MYSPNFRYGLCSGIAAAALCAGLSTPAVALAAPAELVEFSIEAGPLSEALNTYARQSGRQLLYGHEQVASLRAPAVRGSYTREEALRRVLEGSELEAWRSGPNVYVLKTVGAPSLAEGDAASDGEDEAAPPPLAEQTSGAASPVGRLNAPSTLDEVIVTGSLIRGDAPTSPVVAFGRDDIDKAGHPTVAAMLSALPQNFGGVATPATMLLGSDRLGTNDVMSSGVNLRGLGASATLVLVDGRRMAGTGIKGDFADASAIPTAAVQRVEVLLDGASAIYGSDAVGGVVNIILRKDFDGAETRARAAIASGGTAEEMQIGQTFGRAWSSGHALVSYEYYRQNALRAAERDFTASADLRPVSGSDHRLFYSRPGNVMMLDPVSSSYVPTWAIPAGQDGVGLSASSFIAGAVNLENQRAKTDVLPDQERNSAYASLGQSLGEHVEFTADARYSRRRFAFNLPGSVALMNVTTANPFFVSPNGASSNLIAYSFTDELGPLRSTGTSESLGASAGFTARLPRDWRAEAYGAYAQEEGNRSSLGRLNTRFLSEALGAIPDDPATAFSAAQDGYFNPYGDGGANSRGVLGFIAGGYLRSRNQSQVSSLNLKLDGAVLPLPAGDLKAAIGAQVRNERFEARTEAMTSRAMPTLTSAGPYERTNSAAFVELRAPLVGAENALPLVSQLELSLAVRAEHYDDVGTTTNPKVGLLWRPVDGLKLRASYGTSFRAPTLPEVYEQQDVGPAFLPSGPSQTLVLLQSGGNLDLEPEKAKSWTVGFDAAPAAAPGLRFGATWFDTRFEAQIAQPISDDIYNVLGNPAYSPFVTYIDPASTADLARVQALISQSTSANAGLFPPEAYGAIIDGRYVNTGGLHVQGVDFNGAYGFRVADDQVDLTASATWLIDYKRQVTPAAPEVELVGRAGQPVSLRANAGAAWTRGDFVLNTSLDYVGRSKGLGGEKIDAWTSLNFLVRWEPSVPKGALSGLTLSASVRNILDEAPSFYDAPQGVGFDPANGDPLGRVTSLQLTKRW